MELSDGSRNESDISATSSILSLETTCVA